MPARQLYEILQGAIDTHVHAAPDGAIPRRMTVREMAREAEEAGMAGFVFKSHDYCTTPLAQLVTEERNGFIVFGSLCLDRPCGGLNPVAVEIAGKLGTKVIWMPTFDSEQDNKKRGNPGQGIRVIDDKGELLPVVRDILALIREFRMVLATGHLSREEIFRLVPAAREMGIEQIVITHPMTRAVGPTLGIEDQVKLAQMGAWIEHCFVACMPLHDRVAPAEIAAAIKAVGPERTLLASDFGQLHNPSPVEGLRMFAQTMIRCGIDPQDVRRMMVDNPRRLLGL